MQPREKVLLVEDHAFFAGEVAEYLDEERNFNVVTAKTFEDAVRQIKKNGPFAYSFLDILLQNGKTGVDLAETYKKELGRIMFVTGCVDETILSKISQYASASKLSEIWQKLEDFLEGGKPKIDSHETEQYKQARSSAHNKAVRF